MPNLWYSTIPAVARNEAEAENIKKYVKSLPVSGIWTWNLLSMKQEHYLLNCDVW